MKENLFRKPPAHDYSRSFRLSRGGPAIVALALFAAHFIPAQADAAEPLGAFTASSARARNKRAVKELRAKHLEKNADNPDIMSRPGLLAHRGERWIRIWAEAVGISPADPVEFFLIAEDSGHDYETLAVSFARPLDIHDALEFIGMKAGRSVDYEKMQMWPKGERVFMTFEWQQKQVNETGAVRTVTHRALAEKLVIDSRTGEHLPEMGLVFTDSRWLDSEDNPTLKVYAADAYDPQCVASDYNEPLTMLDVPRKAVDGDVYGFQRANPDLPLPAGQLIEILVEPEYKDGKQRIEDLVLRVEPQENTGGGSMNEMRFALVDSKEMPVAWGAELKHVLAAFSRLIASGHDPFVTVAPDKSLTLGGLRELYGFLNSIATDEGIRLEPPSKGDLFYKAFIPNERFREREGRPSQPWELYLSVSGTTATGVLTQIEEIWEEDQVDPDLKPRDFAVSTPEDMRRIISEQGPGVPVMLVFAPPPMKYGILLDFVKQFQATHPTLYVFLPE